jgi:hypothetical protein
MSKSLRFGLAGALILAALGLSYFLLAPGLAESQSKKTLSNLGFDVTYLPEAKHQGSAILYTDVKLDPDAIGTIKSIKMTYAPFGLILGGRFKTIEMEGLNVIGSADLPALLQARPLAADLTGWSPGKPEDVYGGFPTQLIILKNAQISLLTEEYGGVTFNFDFQARRKGNAAEFQSTLKTAQRSLSFSAKANGTIGQDLFFADLDIDQGKIELPDSDTKASRLNGWINLVKPADDALKISGELRAGGARLIGTPWQNASATLDFYKGESKILAEAKSIGVEGLELTLDLEKKQQQPPALSGSLHAESFSQVINYLKAINALPVQANDLKIFNSLPAFDIDFDFGPTFLEADKRLDFMVRSGTPTIITHGKAIIKPDLSFAGKFRSEETSAPLNAGTVSLEGQFIKEAKKDFALDMTTIFKNAAIYGLQNMSGTLNYDHAQKNFSSDKAFGCDVTLPGGAASTCRVNLGFQAGALHVNDLTLSFQGRGKISLSDQQSLKIQNFDLSLLNTEVAKASGTVSGTLPLEFSNAAAFIKNGKLKGEGSGKIQLPAAAVTSFITDKDMQAPIAKALGYYPYQSLEAHINGPLNGNLKLSVLAQTDKSDARAETLPSVLNFDMSIPAANAITWLAR